MGQHVTSPLSLKKYSCVGLPGADGCDNFRVLLIGLNGSGKSSTVNSILTLMDKPGAVPSSSAKTSSGTSSCTYQHNTYKIPGVNLAVSDTWGMNEPSYTRYSKILPALLHGFLPFGWRVGDTLLEKAASLQPGFSSRHTRRIHAVVLVLEAGIIAADDEAAMAVVTENLMQLRCLDYEPMLVISKTDQYVGGQLAADTLCKRPELEKLKHIAAYRLGIAVSNITFGLNYLEDSEKRDFQVDWLTYTLVEMALRRAEEFCMTPRPLLTWEELMAISSDLEQVQSGSKVVKERHVLNSPPFDHDIRIQVCSRDVNYSASAEAALDFASQLAALLPPAASQSGKDLAGFLPAVAEQETLVTGLAQQLSQVHQVITSDVQASVQLTHDCKLVDEELAKTVDMLKLNHQQLASCQATLQAICAHSDEPLKIKALVVTKEQAEATITSLLQTAARCIQDKLNLTKQRQQQKDSILRSCTAARRELPVLPVASPSSGTQALAAVQQGNAAQLQASLALAAAYKDTLNAQSQLQRCLNREKALLDSLAGPLQQRLGHSVQLVGAIAEALHQENPQRELRHTEMLLRDNKQQCNAHAAYQLGKVQARAAIANMPTQQEKQRALAKQLVRAKADHEELLIDGKAREASKAAERLRELATSKAELAAEIEKEAKLLASSDLLANHPELGWEVAANQESMPKLGNAQRLFIPDRKLTDFRIVSHPAATISEAKDSSDCAWALKRIQGDQQSVREAERLVKLQSHPLIVPLQSVFVDHSVTYLQMPFYQHGNLRTWVEQIKAGVQNTSTLSALQKTAVRSTMRQLAQALAYTHQQGVTHRDVKPENVLLQDNGNIALCDFGISKDIIGNAYESTLNLAVAAGTLAYCAPEAGDESWKQFPAAVDAWSFGIMLLELTSGRLFSWVGDKVAYQPSRLERLSTLSRDHLCSDDVWFDAAWDLIEQLLQRNPGSRPSMDSVLMSPFFTSDRFAASISNVSLDWKFRMLSTHLSSIRLGSNRTPVYVIRIQSENTLMAEFLQAFADPDLPLHKVFCVQWGPSSGSIRKPLQEVMDMFLLQLKNDTSPTALFQQCDQPIQLLRDYLPLAVQRLTTAVLQNYQAIGRILAKCLLEGIHVPLSFSVALHCMLVNKPVLSNHADECLAMLAGFDSAESQRLRQMLAARHGDGSDLLLTVGHVMGNDNETALTDGNKEETACAKVCKYMVEDRRTALDAIREGFRSLDISDDMEALSGLELSTLFFGEQYLDVDRLVASFQAEDGAEAAVVRDWLQRFIRSLSENSIRVFVARSTNKLTLPQPGSTLTIEAVPDSSQPRFIPEARHMQLPTCASYEIFASRMTHALRLGEYALRTDVQNEQRLTKEEEQAVIRAMGGEVRAGGYYRCSCGYIYAVGECGGPMQQAACPRCGRVIGGLQHRLADGNEHARFDGTNNPAWPQ